MSYRVHPGYSVYPQLNNLTNQPIIEVLGKPSESYVRINERESYSWFATLGARLELR